MKKKVEGITSYWNRRAERLRINGSAKFNFCSSYQVQC